MDVVIKRIIKKLPSADNVFNSSVEMERNVAKKTAVIKNHCFISICCFKKTALL